MSQHTAQSSKQKRHESSNNHMSIIIFLGRDVKEYESIANKKIELLLSEGKIQCEFCLLAMGKHSSYYRGIKDMAAKINITFVRCKLCEHGHALLPDFLLPYKQYSGAEIESVIIDGASLPVSQIDTEASEPTARRWIIQAGSRIKRAVSILKYLFIEMGQAISEIQINAGYCYSELEQVLCMAPVALRHSNKLGLANMWLGRHSRAEHI